MQKTITFLMFVGEQCGKAEEAINLYISLVKDSAIQHIEYYKAGDSGGKEGEAKHVTFTLGGQTYMAMDSNVDHDFNFSAAVSIYINCESDHEIETLYQRLSDGGMKIMPLGEYPFSKKFAFIADRYGLCWQLNLV